MTQETLFISADWRSALMTALKGDGYTVYAPVRKGEVTQFAICDSTDQIATDIINTQYPLKQVLAISKTAS